MTVQFSREAVAPLSAGVLPANSGLVRRLVRSRNDPGKERIRKWLIDIDDMIHRLKEDVRSWYELHRRNGATNVLVWAT
jgi:hypothetical protein